MDDTRKHEHFTASVYGPPQNGPLNCDARPFLLAFRRKWALYDLVILRRFVENRGENCSLQFP